LSEYVKLNTHKPIVKNIGILISKEPIVNEEISEKEWQNLPLYPIGVAAELVGTSKQTLRLYENSGLIKPSRRNKNRYYSKNDIKWIQCLRNLLHEKKYSIEGLKKLLEYAPCWELKNCPAEIKEECSTYMTITKPCWELNKAICKKASDKVCENCVVFLSRLKKK